MTATYESLLDLDARLATAGVPALSEFWRDTLERFYGHPTARTLVARVGRRGGKSLTATKVALNEALMGSWDVPAGEIHRFAFVSVSKDEAGERLGLIQKCLRALGVPFNARGDEVVLANAPLAFRVCAAKVRATSGFTCYGASLDEGAKWGDKDDADPGEEVATSVGAMLVTHSAARVLLISSAWGLDDWHAQRFEAGDTDDQVTCFAPSWVANPSLSEEATRARCPDPMRWEREYAAQPGDTDQTAFGSKDVEAAFARAPNPGDGERFILIDASKLVHDDFAIAVGTGSASGGVDILAVDGVSPGQGRTLVDAVDRIAALAQIHSAHRVFGDPFESGGLAALLLQRGLVLSTPPWTVKSKHEAGALLGRMFREGLLSLPDHERMRHELLNLRAKLRQNGMVEYPTNGRDYAATLFAMCHAVCDGLLSADALNLEENIYRNLRPGDANTAVRSAIFGAAISGARREMGVLEMANLEEALVAGGWGHPNTAGLDQELATIKYSLENGSTVYYGGALGGPRTAR